MKIEIWSDIMCPFCYIGKRKLEQALSEFAGKDDVQIVWKSFQLDPDLKTDPSRNAVEHLAASKGWSLDYTRQLQGNVAAMGKEAGLEMNFDTQVMANSYNAHRLIQFAKTEGKEGAVAEILFRAHFTQGKNIDDAAVLVELGVEAGLDRAKLTEVVNTNAYSEPVDRDKAEARYLEITGVPFFLFEEKYAVSGAQNVGVFKRALEHTWKEIKG